MITKKEFLIIAIATLITVILWAVSDTLHRRANVEIQSDWQRATKPLDPTFDLGSLQR